MKRRSGKDKSDRQPKWERGRGFVRAGAAARGQLVQAAAKMGFAESDVLTRWPDIAGAALAPLCRPVRVSYRDRRLGATLIVEAEGARAPEVEMSAPRILERVNAFYGYRAVARLKITQTGMPGERRTHGFAETQADFAGPREDAAADGGETLRRAGELAADVENSELRAALTQLGAYVLSKPR